MTATKSTTTCRRLAPQTYRMGEYVAFQTDRLDWTLGKPATWDDPIGGGLMEGTVTYKHGTLRDCRYTVQRRVHIARSIYEDGPRGAWEGRNDMSRWKYGSKSLTRVAGEVASRTPDPEAADVLRRLVRWVDARATVEEEKTKTRAEEPAADIDGGDDYLVGIMRR